MTTTKEICSECKYYARQSETSGLCLGNPPAIHPGGFASRGCTVGANDTGCHLWRLHPRYALDTHSQAGTEAIKEAVSGALARGAGMRTAPPGRDYVPSRERKKPAVAEQTVG